MNNRRKFLSVAGLAVASISIGGLQAQSLGEFRFSAEKDVFKVLAQYGSTQSVQRNPGSTGTVAIKVRMHSHEAFAETFTNSHRLPFDRVHAAGNTLRFQHKGVEFVVQHLA